MRHLCIFPYFLMPAKIMNYMTNSKILSKNHPFVCCRIPLPFPYPPKENVSGNSPRNGNFVARRKSEIAQKQIVALSAPQPDIITIGKSYSYVHKSRMTVPLRPQTCTQMTDTNRLHSLLCGLMEYSMPRKKMVRANVISECIASHSRSLEPGQN